MKKKNYTALFLLRKKDRFCKKFLNITSLSCKSTKVLWADKKKKFLLYKKVKKKYDFIFSYRSPIILTKKDISLAKIAAINLHPGPPKYRGIGCLNYALYNKEKEYGFTVHLINKKSTVSSLLNKTHEQCIKYSKIFFKNILSEPKTINFYKNKFKKEKWSKAIRNKKELNSFYRIKNFNLKEVNNKIRATNYKNFRPFIQISSNKFLFEQNEK